MSYYDDPSSEIFINVFEPLWTFYESNDSLEYRANQDVIVSMSSGGIIPDSMLVDLVEVLKLD